MIDRHELDKAAKSARNLQELLAKLGYGVNGDFFVKGEDRIPATALSKHSVSSFAEWLFDVIRACETERGHIFQVLTKRAERMKGFSQRLRFDHRGHGRVFLSGTGEDGRPSIRLMPALKNCWLGVSVENQEAANERIPLLLKTPAAVRFLSCEPLLGEVQIAEYLPNKLWNDVPSWQSPEIDWVIVGGESGPKARPMNLGWVRSIRDQCQTAGVPFFFKQKIEGGKKIGLPFLDGKRRIEL